MASWTRIAKVVRARRAWVPAVVCSIVAAIAAAVTGGSIAASPAAESAANRSSRSIAKSIRAAAHRIEGADADYDTLLRRIGDARIVLLGEDTHGTREFYIERARITQRLIDQHGFSAVVIEGDWSEAAGLRAILTGNVAASDIDHSLRAFRRFPGWMWANTDFRDFLLWLRSWNARRPPDAEPVVVHGMDLYDIQGSIEVVLRFLEPVNPDAAVRARADYACLETSGAATGTAVGARWPDIDCSSSAQQVLTTVASGVDGVAGSAPDNGVYIDALQNARIAANGEAYARAMHHGSEHAWDLRDRHMASTIDLLLAHLDAVSGHRSRVVVWAHNAHVGDAAATSRGEAGFITIGQLLRERYPGDTVSVGFITATGDVRAAHVWGGADRVMRLTPPLRHTHAALLRQAGVRRFYLVLDAMRPLPALLERPRLQRGIGVRYVKKLEIEGGHYYRARLGRQFDALVFIDRTHALRPLRGR